jgi:transcriptional regulator with XRE-family HTH domain
MKLKKERSKKTSPVRTQTFTEADFICSDNLHNLWKQKSKSLNLTQEKAGEALGITQSAVSQYMRRRISWSMERIVQWARLMQVAETDICPHFGEIYGALHGRTFVRKTVARNDPSGNIKGECVVALPESLKGVEAYSLTEIEQSIYPSTDTLLVDDAECKEGTLCLITNAQGSMRLGLYETALKLEQTKRVVGTLKYGV